MNVSGRWAAAAIVITGLLLAACKQNVAEAPSEAVEPATIERLEGINPTKVTLTEDAMRRLDIQTATVSELQVNGVKRKVIPYAAILYDTEGATWTYVSPEPKIYLRHPIKVDFIQGNDVILTDDMPAGTSVVIIGAAELYGSETEFSEE